MKAVLSRELRRIRSRPLEPLLLFVLPALALALSWAIFDAGLPRGLPVAVLDEDETPLSRQLVRMVDATPAVRVAERPADAREAEELVLSGRAYAWLVVPRGFERDVRRGRPASVVAYTNAQLLVPSSLVRRDLQAASATLSAGIELRRLRAGGESGASAAARVEPVRAELHALFNPQLDYVAALVLPLFATLLHVFVLLAAVNSVGSELREGTAAEWLAAAGGSLPRALAGKLLPSSASFLLVASAGALALFAGHGVPLRGSAALLAAATLLFVIAYQALGVLLVALVANLRLATSLAAFLASPAFAYAGITFPTLGMPAFARFWGALLPLTHYLRLLVDQSLRGAPAAADAPALVALAGSGALALVIALPRLGRVARDPRYWGGL